MNYGKSHVSLSIQYPQYKIGRYSYGNPIIFDWEQENSGLTIGAFCSMAAGVTFVLGGEHRPEYVTTYPCDIYFEEVKQMGPHSYSKGKIVIGNDVWIATNAIILSGATIGDGAIIGAGSVVAKSIPPYAVVCGNPAQVIRYRFSDEIIQKLLQIQWWNWPDEIIKKMMPYLFSNNVSAFFTKAEELKKEGEI